MPEIQLALRNKIKHAGKTIADVARESQITYSRLSGFFNGYHDLGYEQKKKIEKIISNWSKGITNEILVPNRNNKYQAICKKCGLVDVDVTLNGPHYEVSCSICISFIKFISKKNIHPIK